MEIRGIRPRIGPLCLTTAGSPTSPAARLRLTESLMRPGRPDVIRKMLVIDDEEAFLRTVTRTFSSLTRIAEFELITLNPSGSTQEQALEQITAKLAANDIDLIVMDGLMPGISGKDLITVIRAGGYAGYIAGNSSMPNVQGQLIEAGADFLMPEKSPVSWQSLFIKT